MTDQTTVTFTLRSWDASCEDVMGYQTLRLDAHLESHAGILAAVEDAQKRCFDRQLTRLADGRWSGDPLGDDDWTLGDDPVGLFLA